MLGGRGVNARGRVLLAVVESLVSPGLSVFQASNGGLQKLSGYHFCALRAGTKPKP